MKNVLQTLIIAALILFVIELRESKAGNVGIQKIGSSVNAAFPSTNPTNPYCRWIRRSDNKIWDGDSFETSPTWSSSVVQVSLGTYTKLRLISVPSGIEIGGYDIAFYDNSSPANTDVPFCMKYVYVLNGEFIEMFDM